MLDREALSVGIEQQQTPRQSDPCSMEVIMEIHGEVCPGCQDRFEWVETAPCIVILDVSFSGGQGHKARDWYSIGLKMATSS